MLKDIKAFLSSIESKQEERIKSISELVTQLFSEYVFQLQEMMYNKNYTLTCINSIFILDDDEHLRQVSQIVAENNDMLDSFTTVSKELAVLQTKLKSSSVIVEV